MWQLDYTLERMSNLGSDIRLLYLETVKEYMGEITNYDSVRQKMCLGGIQWI